MSISPESVERSSIFNVPAVRARWCEGGLERLIGSNSSDYGWRRAFLLQQA